MRSPSVLTCGFYAFVCLAGLGSGCPPPGAGTDSSNPAADESPAGDPVLADDEAASAAGAQVAQGVDAGLSSTDALAHLTTTLQADPAVAGVANADDLNAVWAVFNSGLIYIYEVVDDDEDLDSPDVTIQAQRAIAPLAVQKTAPVADTLNVAGQDPPCNGPAVQKSVPVAMDSAPPPTGSGVPCRLPAGTRVLLANSLTVGQPLQDIRQPIKKMLTDRGYQVDVRDADLETFKHLTDYGLIFIEAHGSALMTMEWISGLLNSMQIKYGLQNLPNCGYSGGQAVLFTTTVATEAAKAQYREDRQCGRLVVRHATVRKPGQPSYVDQFFAVTPNFIRQYNTGRFPDRTFMFISACASFHSTGSAWLDLLYEKSTGGGLVGWYKQVHYDVSSRAMLNLFQLATGSNEEFSLTSARSKKTYVLLAKNTPPMATMTLSGALGPLQQRNWCIDPRTGAIFGMQWDWTKDLYTPILAPEVVFLIVGYDSKTIVSAACAENTQFVIGGCGGDLGAYGPQSLPGVSAEGYKITLPMGCSGRMSLTGAGRSGPGRDLLAYKPVIAINGSGDHNFKYTISAQLYGRGMPTGRTPFWGPTTREDFAIQFEEAGSNLTWVVSGHDDDGATQWDYSGGGSLKCKFYDPNSVYQPDRSYVYVSGELPDGLQAHISIEDVQQLPYTVTTTNLQNGLSISQTQYLTAAMSADDVPVSSALVISAGSVAGASGNETGHWSAFGPQPAFDRSTSPR